ncbi:winged helix-turn-helix transcriptional regulator [Pseudorhodoplanes sp.]|uniref:winged helix-turn-helix transcriptional regulator n=1 Tax=Pseudorhodoplanes sp. TaxID=1934341 RepID=UPI002C77CCC3|nr:winged helix-turn-helix transcriptional regulator [Pseudorhodoplanes sp.]HWV54446.1 winged helix-turn-helix transcriptional regulator [Pseudorhodoplanes sp.]
MKTAQRHENADRVVLRLLESVEANGLQSQRHLATEMGVALGLVNAYLKKCVNKGLIKFKQAPAKRYKYYLTPRGFAEKSRLTVSYLSHSLAFFRRARADCASVLAEIRTRGWRRVALIGATDLAEIARLCAPEHDVAIVLVVDPLLEATEFGGIPVVRSLDELSDVEAVVVTDLSKTREIYRTAVKKFGSDRVYAPELLLSKMVSRGAAA